MRFLRVTHSIPDGMAVVVDTPLGGDPPHRRLQDRPDAARRPGDRPPRARRGGGRARACTSSSRTRPTPRSPGTRSASAASVRCCATSSRSAPAHRRRGVLLEPHPPHPADRGRRAGRTGGWWRSWGGRCTRPWSAARRLGLLHVADQDVVDIEEVDKLDPGRVVVICTGSPGRALLGAVADGRARAQVGRSSGRATRSSSRPRLIPGNEPAIHRVVDALYRTGGRRVPHARRPGARLRPRRAGGAQSHAVAGQAPLVHPGPRRAAAPAAPRAPRRTRSASRANGSSARTATSWRSASAVKKVDRVQAGMTFVDGLGIGDVGGEVLRDRRKLAGDGWSWS